MNTDHLKDFRERGLENVRLQIRDSNFAPEKHKDAEKWVYKEDHRYQRRAYLVSFLAMIISAAAVCISGYSAINAHKADRAWLGPSRMRLSHKPAGGKDLRFFLDYQNTGRQPAQDVFYEMDSYTYNKQMTPDIDDRAKRHIERCKNSAPSDERLTLFPGKGTFEPYSVDKQFATSAATGASTTIFVDGCFVYRTLNEIHRTAFCFEYDPQTARDDDDGKPVMNLCTHGHYAD